MELIREFSAVIGFIAGSVLIVCAFSTPFVWHYLFIGLAIYLVCYFIWPGKRRGKRKDDSPILDILELVIEFPVEMVLWIFRLIWRLLRAIFAGKGDGFDIDL